MKLQGRLKQIGETVSFDSGLQIKECIITTDGKYPQDIPVKFFKDKCALLDSYRVGSEVEIAYNLRGNSYNNKKGETIHRSEVVGWNIEPLSTSNAVQQPDRDDLPF